VISAALGGTIRGEFMNSENGMTNADLIIINAKIATQNERREFAESIAIKDGKFIAVGQEREVMRL
jgi:adenine deaminase